VSGISNDFFIITSSNKIIGKKAPSRAKKTIKANDVIYATVRPYLKRIAIVPESLDNEICSTAFCVLRCQKKKLDPLFLYFLVQSDYFTNKIVGLQRGSSYPAVSDNDIKKQKIGLPSYKEQIEIGRILKKVSDKILIENSKKQALQSLFKSMLHKLMTGQIRLKDVSLGVENG
jgi:type I restriction enzyme S subunit